MPDARWFAIGKVVLTNQSAGHAEGQCATVISPDFSRSSVTLHPSRSAASVRTLGSTFAGASSSGQEETDGAGLTCNPETADDPHDIFATWAKVAIIRTTTLTNTEY